jgi:hypothetical protein
MHIYENQYVSSLSNAIGINWHLKPLSHQPYGSRSKAFFTKIAVFHAAVARQSYEILRSQGCHNIAD